MAIWDAVTGVIVFQKSVFRAERHETLSKDQAEMLQQAIPEEFVLSASAGIAYVIPAESIFIFGEPEVL